MMPYPDGVIGAIPPRRVEIPGRTAPAPPGRFPLRYCVWSCTRSCNLVVQLRIRHHKPQFLLRSQQTADRYVGRVSDEEAMGEALNEAQAALSHGDVPVGAVIVVDGAVVARDHNRREERQDPTAHAEVLALRAAADALGAWRMGEATVYVTLEPCPMCAGALVAARTGRVVFGAFDPKAGAVGSLYNLCADPRLNHEVAVTHGVRAQESAALLEQFFAARRR